MADKNQELTVSHRFCCWIYQTVRTNQRSLKIPLKAKCAPHMRTQSFAEEYVLSSSRKEVVSCYGFLLISKLE